MTIAVFTFSLLGAMALFLIATLGLLLRPRVTLRR